MEEGDGWSGEGGRDEWSGDGGGNEWRREKGGVGREEGEGRREEGMIGVEIEGREVSEVGRGR